MAAKKDKVIRLILRWCVFHLMIPTGDFLESGKSRAESVRRKAEDAFKINLNV